MAVVCVILPVCFIPSNLYSDSAQICTDRRAETMRKYPPVQALARVCTKPFQVPGTDVELDVGTAVLIPVYAIHHDPQYYPEPDAFDPDRFAKSDAATAADDDGAAGDCNESTRPAGVYLPFGDGPRICIGAYYTYTCTIYFTCTRRRI